MSVTRTGDEDLGFDRTEVTGKAAPEDGLAHDLTGSSLASAPLPGRLTTKVLLPGTLVGEYRIEGQIGEGGMGVVFSAVHPVIGKRAAIKVLRAELDADPMAIVRFVDEARVVNQIGHPNIVDIFAFGQLPDGRHYFVMEWLGGETLRARLARGPVPLADACTIVRALVRALEAAHGKGVVHRDLKPDNIFLEEVAGEAVHVKLLDFGIAKLSAAEHRLERTASGQMIGTPLYIAPEQAKGQAIDHRADIYTLGGILFELLTGRTPFIADNPMEVIAKHLMEPAPAPSAFAQGVPPELDAIVVAMLAKAPEARPSLAALARVLDGTPRALAATPPLCAPTTAPAPALTPVAHTTRAHGERAPRSRRGLGVALAVVGIVAIAAASFAIVRTIRGDGSGSAALPMPIHATPIQGMPIPAHTVDGAPAAPTPTPAPVPAPSAPAIAAPNPPPTAPGPLPVAKPTPKKPVKPPRRIVPAAGSDTETFAPGTFTEKPGL